MKINLNLCVSTTPYLTYEVMRVDFHESNSALDIAVFGVFPQWKHNPVSNRQEYHLQDKIEHELSKKNI